MQRTARRTVTRSVQVVYTFDGKWWTAEAPILRGAFSQGRTRASAKRNLLGAIRDLASVYAEQGRPLPWSGTVRVERLDLTA